MNVLACTYNASVRNLIDIFVIAIWVSRSGHTVHTQVQFSFDTSLSFCFAPSHGTVRKRTSANTENFNLKYSVLLSIGKYTIFQYMCMFWQLHYLFIFSWSLYCLSFFDLQFLITSYVSSNFSCTFFRNATYDKSMYISNIYTNSGIYCTNFKLHKSILISHICFRNYV